MKKLKDVHDVVFMEQRDDAGNLVELRIRAVNSREGSIDLALLSVRPVLGGDGQPALQLDQLKLHDTDVLDLRAALNRPVLLNVRRDEIDAEWRQHEELLAKMREAERQSGEADTSGR